MLLNRLEFALMNNPVRAAFQRRFEAPQLLELGGPMHGGRALLHPKSDRFDTAQFCRALHEAGLPTESTREVLGVLLWVVATKK